MGRAAALEIGQAGFEAQSLRSGATSDELPELSELECLLL